MLESYYSDTAKAIQFSHSKKKVPVIDFHLHNGFEIYFLISGDVNYFVEKKVYPIKFGDLLITNNHEIHKPSFQSDTTYERITIIFNPCILRSLNSPDFDMLNCFINRPKGERNKVSLTPPQIEEILKLFNKIETASRSISAGSDILKLAYFVELMVFINRVYKSNEFMEEHYEEHYNVPEKLIPVLDFIEENLQNDLSLEALERNFYINRFHLSRMFKKSTGCNIHQYVVFKRISKAKRLLGDGYSVTDTCQICGFKDYSNFIRIFKKTVGFPPGQFKKKRVI